jgi:hypothetical protein
MDILTMFAQIEALFYFAQHMFVQLNRFRYGSGLNIRLERRFLTAYVM